VLLLQCRACNCWGLILWSTYSMPTVSGSSCRLAANADYDTDTNDDTNTNDAAAAAASCNLRLRSLS